MNNFKVIACDFDGTLCENKWPEIGNANEEIINYLKERKNSGIKIILWTCRVDEMLKNAVEWCRDRGLVFDAVNENIPEVINLFGTDTRKIFANEYIDDRNSINFKLPFISSNEETEQSHLLTWAENEVKLACELERGDTPETEWDYVCACYESALRVLNSLIKDGHSGFSIGLTKQILNRLIDCKPLTPIEDTEDVWYDITDTNSIDGEVANYQCKRKGSLFKYVYSDGTIKYKDVDLFCCINVNKPMTRYYNGLVDNIMHEIFPIKMPYYSEDSIKVYCEDFLSNKENGDFDTIGIMYIIKPNGKKIRINRYFKENDDKGFVEIGIGEYKQRKKESRSIVANESLLKMYKKQKIKIAKDLCYNRYAINKILLAKSIPEVDRVLTDARKGRI